jgi:hypothetical protein
MNLFLRTTFLFSKEMLLSMCVVIKIKNGIQDLEKIIHYCELEIKKDERYNR